ncbi:MAG: 4'-phosphopantetheinyl transferase superfamily protein [Bacteroidaceae bacterium]|nr:4'-phosphopantetheinyl transferase superfamily protein [Bacteroidaceae bacterium]
MWLYVEEYEMIYINDKIYSFDLQEALAQLSEQRREQALKFKHELGQRTCAAAYLLLCDGLRKEYGIIEKPVFEYGEHGKPSLLGYPHIQFNFSHCREAVICILSNQPVGVDIESIRPFKQTLVDYTMNEEEVARIQQAERPDFEFIKLWTQKEAVLKLSGDGISKDMKQVLLNPPASLTTVISEDERYVYSYCY